MERRPELLARAAHEHLCDLSEPVDANDAKLLGHRLQVFRHRPALALVESAHQPHETNLHLAAGWAVNIFSVHNEP